ncbi:MAG: hypothetical protein IJE05_03425 [Clostridia bacterium]|nr:hypothetical protein [Clostridia bacterium]
MKQLQATKGLREEEYCIESLYKCELFLRKIENLGSSVYISANQILGEIYLIKKEKDGKSFFWDPITNMMYRMDDKKYINGEIVVRKNMPPELTEEDKRKRYINKARLIELNEKCKKEE